MKALGKPRRIQDDKRAPAEAALARFRRRLSEIAELDFFDAPGREATASLFDSVEPGAYRAPSAP